MSTLSSMIALGVPVLILIVNSLAGWFINDSGPTNSYRPRARIHAGATQALVHGRGVRLSQRVQSVIAATIVISGFLTLPVLRWETVLPFTVQILALVAGAHAASRIGISVRDILKPRLARSERSRQWGSLLTMIPMTCLMLAVYYWAAIGL